MHRRPWLNLRTLPLMLVALLLLVVVGCGAAATATPIPTNTPAPTAITAPTPTTVAAATAAPAPTKAAAAVPTTTPSAAAQAGVTRAPEANPKRGGILKIGGLSNPSHFDLHGCASVACIGPQSKMYDSLIRFSPFDFKTIIPDLAYKWEVSPDGLTFTFFLREGVKFHDGGLLTSEDVKATFDRIIFPPPGFISERKDIFEAVKEIKTVDPLTVQFVLKEPRGFLPQAIASDWNVIVRKKTLVDNNFDLKRVKNFPGTGPFRLVDWKVGEILKLERNKDYWNPELPYLDGIDLYHINGQAESGAALLAKTIDYTYRMDPVTLGRAKITPGLKASVVPIADYQGLWFNLKRKPFDDPKVRRAIHLVIDRQAMVNIIEDVTPMAIGAWVPASDPLGQSVRAETLKLPGWRDNKTDDIKEAQKLMQEAGHPNGFKAELLIIDVTQHIRWGPVVQDTLKRNLKIETTIRQVSNPVGIEELQKGNFDLASRGVGASLDNAVDYWGNKFRSGASQNWGHYSSPRLDTLLDQITLEGEPQKYQDLLRQASKVMDEEVPMVVFGHFTHVYGWWDYVKGHRTDIRGSIYSNHRYDTWWLDK